MSTVHSITALSDEAFHWYVTGLADGEGCFTLARKKATWLPSFVVSMRLDELPHLTAIWKRMRCGTMSMLNGPATTQSHATAKWSVSKASDLLTIVEHFDLFPLQLKKANDFRIWKPCALMYYDITRRFHCGHRTKKWTQAEHDFMADSAARLKVARQYDSETIPYQDHFSRPRYIWETDIPS